MNEFQCDECKTSFNNDPNLMPIFASQEPFPKFCEPNISHNSKRKDYLESMYQFVTLNEKDDFGSPKEGQLPNYIVPVLYVPHRIVTNEELQRLTPFYHAEPPAEGAPKQNKNSNVILTDSESKIYQRLTNKLRGNEILESDRDDYVRYEKNCFFEKNSYKYSNPHYTVTSNSDNCLTASIQNNTSCTVPSASGTSNDGLRITDSIQNVSNIKSSNINNNSTTSKGHSKQHSMERMHSKIPKLIQEKLDASTDCISHLQSKITQTKYKMKQNSTQTKANEEEPYNDDTLFDSKSDCKQFSSFSNVLESLEEDASLNDHIEIKSEDNFLISVISSPLDEVMTPKLRTHSKIN